MILQNTQVDHDVQSLSVDEFHAFSCSATRHKTFDGEDDDLFLVHSRSAINDDERWPKNKDGKVYIPYGFGGVGFTADQKKDIAKAMKIYSEKTCIRFRPKKSGDKAYITLNGVSDKGCIGFSPVGYHKAQAESGKHILRIPGKGVKGCPKSIVGLYFHELMHTVGFEHEHVRPDRDKYVKVLFDKIQPKFRFASNVTKTHTRLIGKYDYLSIMHYSKGLFAIKPGDVTIETKDPKFQDKIGMHKGSLGPENGGVNDLDIKKINTLYKCSGYPTV